MKKIQAIFSNSKLYPILLFILIIPSFINLIRPGFFTMQDDLQAFRLQQLDTCIQDLQIPCRWTPDAGFGYGYPKFNYYSPLPFYVGELIHLSGIQFIDVVKILFILGFILSAFSMYLLLKTLFDEKSALVGALLYTYAPFRAAEVYVRGAMGEFLAFIFFPLIFWSSYQLIQKLQKKYILYLAFSISGLILTHNLSTLIFMPILIVWCLFWLGITKRWSALIWLSVSAVLVFSLSAFFVLPSIFERQYVHVESLLGGYFDYRQHFVSFNQLLFSNYFGYGSSVLGLKDEVALEIGWILGITGFLGLVLAGWFYKKNKTYSWMIFLLGFTTLIVLFLMHQRSSFIWEQVSVLAWLQFPWRFLAITTFLLSIIGSSLIYYIQEFKTKYFTFFMILFIILGLFIAHSNFFKPKDWYPLTDQEKFTGKSWETQLTVSIFDYLPIYSKFPPPYKASMIPEITDGSAKITNYYKGGNYQFGELIATSSATVRLPLYDFPGMTVKVDHKVISHNHNNCKNEPFCMGLISFEVSPGKHKIEVSLQNTWIRTIGNLLTVTTLIGILFFVIFVSLKNKK